MTSLYEHAGGQEALHRLEELFYTKVVADPLLKSLFTERRPHHVEHLTWFTAESFGGPDRFTRDLGFQHIIDVHRHLKITDEQRERFVALYMESLDEAGASPTTSRSGKRCARISSSARASHSRTRGLKPMPSFIPSATFRTGSGWQPPPSHSARPIEHMSENGTTRVWFVTGGFARPRRGGRPRGVGSGAQRHRGRARPGGRSPLSRQRVALAADHRGRRHEPAADP